MVRLIHGFPEDGIAPGTLAVVIDVDEPRGRTGSGSDEELAYALEVHLPGRPLYTASATTDQLEALLKPGRRELWIMPEYRCRAFWATDGTTSGVHDNIAADADVLGLSPALVAAVQEWEASYEATYVPDDPMSSGFPDAGAEASFRETGRQLAERVAAELGSGWDVVYRYGTAEH